MASWMLLGWWCPLYNTRLGKRRKHGELFLMPFVAWRKNKEGDWQTEYWYMDNMDGGEQREKDLAQDLEEQGCMIEWQDV